MIKAMAGPGLSFFFSHIYMLKVNQINYMV